MRDNVLTAHGPENALRCASTQQLLGELFTRFKEAVFIGHVEDAKHPIHMASHLPDQTTNMHGILVTALERVLASVKRKHVPEARADDRVRPFPG